MAGGFLKTAEDTRCAVIPGYSRFTLCQEFQESATWYRILSGGKEKKNIIKDPEQYLEETVFLLQNINKTISKNCVIKTKMVG